VSEQPKFSTSSPLSALHWEFPTDIAPKSSFFSVHCLETDVTPCYGYMISPDRTMPADAWSTSISQFIGNPVVLILLF